MATHNLDDADFAAIIENAAKALNASGISIYRSHEDQTALLHEWASGVRATHFLRASHCLLPFGTFLLVVGFAGSSALVPDAVADRLLLFAVADWSAKELTRLRAEVIHLNQRLAERKIVERAKALLQAEHGFDEEQAYAYLRRTSRRRRTPIAAISEELLRSADFQGAAV